MNRVRKQVGPSLFSSEIRLVTASVSDGPTCLRARFIVAAQFKFHNFMARPSSRSLHSLTEDEVAGSIPAGLIFSSQSVAILSRARI